MASGSSSSSRGIGLLGMLFITFLVLKLGVGNTVVVGWSWWWVAAPLWGAPIVFAVTAGAVFSAIYLGFCAESAYRWIRRR